MMNIEIAFRKCCEWKITHEHEHFSILISFSKPVTSCTVTFILEIRTSVFSCVCVCVDLVVMYIQCVCVVIVIT